MNTFCTIESGIPVKFPSEYNQSVDDNSPYLYFDISSRILWIFNPEFKNRSSKGWVELKQCNHPNISIVSKNEYDDLIYKDKLDANTIYYVRGNYDIGYKVVELLETVIPMIHSRIDHLESKLNKINE